MRQRRTQVQRRAETQRRVLDAATELVAARGSRAVSLAAVGAAAGYSRGIVNHHFGTKARLLEALIRHTQQFDVPDDAPTGLGRLTAFIAAYLGGMWDRTPRSEAFLRLWAEAAGAEPALATLFIERDAAFKASVAQYIRDGQADGSIRGDARPDTAALAVIGQLRGAAMLAFSTARDVPIADLTNEVLRLVEQGLAAR